MFLLINTAHTRINVTAEMDGGEIEYSIYQITNDSNQGGAMIYQGFIAWEVEPIRNGPDNIQFYNQSSKQIINLTNNTKGSGDALIAISNLYVIWEELGNPDNLSHVFDIKQNKIIELSGIEINGPACLYNDLLAMTKPIWLEDTVLEFDILVYNITTGQTLLDYHAEGNQTYPQIWGDYVIWIDENKNNGDISGYNFKTKTEFIIANDSDVEFPLAIWGTNLLYVKGLINDAPIYYIYNLSSYERITVPTISKVDNNKIEWVDLWGNYIFGYNGGCLYIYSISNDTLFYINDNIYSFYMTVTSNPIYQNKFVFSDGEGILLLEFYIPGVYPPPDGNNSDDDKSHNNLSIPSATMAFLIMSIILIAIIRRKN